MEIKDIIRKRREELNLTYEQLGNIIGVGKSTVRKWETGMIENMRRDNIVALAKALKISPAVIMGWNDSTETLDISQCCQLSKKETALLSNFNKLNNVGKEEAIKRIEELTLISKYTTTDNLCDTGKPYLVACHDDDLSIEEKDTMNEKINKFLNK